MTPKTLSEEIEDLQERIIFWTKVTWFGFGWVFGALFVGLFQYLGR